MGFLLTDGVWGFIGLRGLRSVFAVAFGPLVLPLVQPMVAQAQTGRSIGFVSSTSALGDVGAQLPVGVLLSRTSRTAVAAIGFVVLAAGYSAMDVGTVSVIADSVPSPHESAFVGLRSTAVGIGGVLGPSLIGITATVTSFETAFVIASVFPFAAAFLIQIKLAEPPHRTQPTTALQTIETSSGTAQLPGMHRGQNSG